MPRRLGGKREGATVAGDVTERRRNELQEVGSHRKGMMAMPHGDEKRGTADADYIDYPECALSIIKHTRAGMEPDEVANSDSADLLKRIGGVRVMPTW